MALVRVACGDGGPILVGYAGPLRGRYADLGVQGRNGAQLAIEDINAAGGVAGRRLELLAADDSDWREGEVNATRQLIEAGVVAVIGHMTSSPSLAALPQVERAGLVMISPTASTPLLDGKRDAFFRVAPSSRAWAEALARHALAAMGLRKVTPLVDLGNEAYTVPFVEAFARTFAQGGGMVTPPLGFQSPVSPSLLLEEALRTHPDALLLAASSGDVAALLLRLRGEGEAMPVLLAHSAYTREKVELGCAAVEGVIASMSYFNDMPMPQYRTFQERHAARFGAPPNFAAAHAWDAVQVLGRALATTGGSARGLREALEALPPLEGSMGVVRMDHYGDVTRPAYILSVREGRLIMLGPAAP